MSLIRASSPFPSVLSRARPDAELLIVACVRVIPIGFPGYRASDKCMKEKRKTINGDDLIWSMGTLGFEDYVEPLKLYLKLYREVPLSSSPLCPLAKLLVLLPLTNFAPLGCFTHVL